VRQALHKRMRAVRTRRVDCRPPLPELCAARAVCPWPHRQQLACGISGTQACPATLAPLSVSVVGRMRHACTVTCTCQRGISARTHCPQATRSLRATLHKWQGDPRALKDLTPEELQVGLLGQSRAVMPEQPEQPRGPRTDLWLWPAWVPAPQQSSPLPAGPGGADGGGCGPCAHSTCSGACVRVCVCMCMCVCVCCARVCCVRVCECVCVCLGACICSCSFPRVFKWKSAPLSLSLHARSSICCPSSPLPSQAVAERELLCPVCWVGGRRGGGGVGLLERSVQVVRAAEHAAACSNACLFKVGSPACCRLCERGPAHSPPAGAEEKPCVQLRPPDVPRVRRAGQQLPHLPEVDSDPHSDVLT